VVEVGDLLYHVHRLGFAEFVRHRRPEVSVFAGREYAKAVGFERFPVVPYAFTSEFFGFFKNRDEREPQLVTDQVLYNTPGCPGADFHTMFLVGAPRKLQPAENRSVNACANGGEIMTASRP
jgi:hypothetical protein